MKPWEKYQSGKPWEKYVPKAEKSFSDRAVEFGGAMVRGARDIVDGGARLLVRGAEAVVPDGNRLDDWLKSEVSRVDSINAAAEQDYQQNWGGQDRGFDTGRVIGAGVASMPIGAVGLAGKGYRLAKAAGTGGLLGAMSTSADDKNYWADTAENAALGAGFGLVGDAAGRVVSRMVQPKGNQAANLLSREGVSPQLGGLIGRPAQRIEQALESAPILGDVIRSGRTAAIKEFNRAAVNRALAPIGQKLPKGMVGSEAITFAKKALGDAYDDVLSKVTVYADDALAKDLASLADSIPNVHGDQTKRKFAEIVFSELGKRFDDGVMPGNGVKALQENVRKIADRYRQGSPDDRAIADALIGSGGSDGFIGAIRNAVQRHAGDAAARIDDINLGYANFARVRDAASKVTAEHGVFSPEQLRASVRALDRSVGKGQSAQGNALMQDLADAGVDALGAKLPNSGTTDRYLINSLTGAGAGYGAATGLLGPYSLLAGAVPAVPYAPGVRGLLATAMTRHGPRADKYAQAVRQSLPLLGISSVPALLSE